MAVIIEENDNEKLGQYIAWLKKYTVDKDITVRAFMLDSLLLFEKLGSYEDFEIKMIIGEEFFDRYFASKRSK